MELEWFVERVVRRHLLLALAIAVALYFFAPLEIAGSVLYGSMLGILNGLMLALRVRSVTDFDTRQAKRAIQRNLLKRFVLASLGFAVGMGYLGLNVAGIIAGFSLFQVIASFEAYREAVPRKAGKLSAGPVADSKGKVI